MILTDAGIEMLCAAIIKQACDDYMMAYMALVYIRRDPSARLSDIQSREKEVKRLEKWFSSAWFDLICGLDGRYLIEQIQKKVEGKRR